MTVPSTDDILEKNILDLLDLQDIPEEKKQEIYQKLYKTVESRVILRMDSLLNDAEAAEWGKLLEANDRAASDAFLKERHIDVEQLMLQESAIFKAELVYLLTGPNPIQAKSMTVGA